MTSPASPADEKARLRKHALAVRAEAARSAPGAGEALAAHAPALPSAAVVSAYVPMRSEIDPMPLAMALEAAGARLALPSIANRRMTFRLWKSGDPLVPGTFGTMEPTGEPVTPDLLLVPLLAFTRAGLRLGYGGGYYDGWLAAHPSARAFGVAHAAQEVASLPREPHDVPLAAILTEREFIKAGEGA